jgi:Tol biopolymer transport system component
VNDSCVTVKIPLSCCFFHSFSLRFASRLRSSGTGGASDPFFSPDGQWVGFFADSKMKKISVLGGAPVTLCDSPSGRGASWGEDGNIIAALNNEVGLSRIHASGGTPQPVTKMERGELTHGWPQVLPGGKAILFTSSRATVTYVGGTVEAFRSPE